MGKGDCRVRSGRQNRPAAARWHCVRRQLFDSALEDQCRVPGSAGHQPRLRQFADRIVTPYEPRVVVVFAGGNDIAAGKTPEQVFEDFKALTAKIHAKLPKTKIYYVSLFPTVARQKIDDKFRESNGLIETYTKSDPIPNQQPYLSRRPAGR